MINALVKTIEKRHMQFMTSAPNFRGGGQLALLTRPTRAPAYILDMDTSMPALLLVDSLHQS